MKKVVLNILISLFLVIYGGYSAISKDDEIMILIIPTFLYMIWSSKVKKRGNKHIQQSGAIIQKGLTPLFNELI